MGCATMIRTECRRLINHLFDNGKINEVHKEKWLEYIKKESTHTKIRNLILIILLPKKLHIDGEHQAAFLRAAVSRIANKTVLEQEGLFFLRPVYDVVFQDVNYLKLPRSSVSVCYKVYDNTYKDGNR